MVQSELIPVTRAAKRTALGEPAIRRRLRAGQIRGQKLGRDWFVAAAEVERLAVEYPLY